MKTLLTLFIFFFSSTLFAASNTSVNMTCIWDDDPYELHIFFIQIETESPSYAWLQYKYNDFFNDVPKYPDLDGELRIVFLSMQVDVIDGLLVGEGVFDSSPTGISNFNPIKFEFDTNKLKLKISNLATADTKDIFLSCFK